jgi:hypothetical protein
MFTIRKSKNKGLRSSTSSSQKPINTNLGVDSKSRSAKKEVPEKIPTIGKNNFISESYQMPTALGPNANISSNAITIDTEPLLTGLTPQVEQAFYRLYRDIYYFDSVAGSAVDLISQVTFSGEFSLGGISDPKIKGTYEEVIERLNCKTLFPEMSTDHLVLGAHCSSLLYNSEKKVFADLMCHAREQLTITDIPFYSQDPIINVRFSEQTVKTLSENSPTVKSLKELVGDKILAKIRSGSLDLDTLTTIYIPRKSFSFTEQGTSYFKRILPLYLIEKNLYRGTLVESARRQRGIMHLTIGDGEEWIPQVTDLEFMTDLFMNADSDPLGAIVATRSGVSVEEIRQGGDFWKVTDFADSVLPYKLRALGVSEGFLSGEANYNVADASMTIFIEMLRSYRDMMTRKFFYERVFPLVSMVNGYTINAKGKFAKSNEISKLSSMAEALNKMNDGSKLLIPTVTWAKQLKPEGDTAYMDMLNSLTEKGVPIPLRVLAAAGGLNLEELLRQKEDDLELRKKLAEYMKEIQKFAPQPEEGAEESESSAVPFRSVSGASAVLQKRLGKRPSILSRDFDNELIGRSKTGKAKVISSRVQAKRNEKMNTYIIQSMKANLKKERNAPTPFKPDNKKTF